MFWEELTGVPSTGGAKGADTRMADSTLADWGEFRLLDEVVLPVLRDVAVTNGLGDDVAYIPLGPTGDHLVITCDVAPKPLAWKYVPSPYWSWGWYAVLPNASDLASAGAEPLAFTSSVEAPSSMTVEEFRQFFAGMAEACRQFRMPNAGGNIRMAPRFACHGTAIGTVTTGQLLTRSGCKPGDTLAVIGECGSFVTAYLRARARGFSSLAEGERQLLMRPGTRLREMAILRKAGVLHATSDNSDGILGSLWNIVERSKCAVDLVLDDALIPPSVRDAAQDEHVDPWNLMFFWGDWQVVVAIAKDALDEFRQIARQQNIAYTVLGSATEGPPALSASRGGSRRSVNIVRNENFRTQSYNASPDVHVEFMLRTPILSH